MRKKTLRAIALLAIVGAALSASGCLVAAAGAAGAGAGYVAGNEAAKNHQQ